MAFMYFDIKHATRVQDFIIENSGGRKGILNIGLIESVLEHIKNDLYYPSIEHKICHLFYSVNKNHAFNDGNKRSSIALSSYFMEINALGFKVDHFIKEMENITVHVADNKVSKELLFEIIHSVIHQDDYSEELKLKIFNALSSNDEGIEDNIF